jgi:hypothetical protein
MKYMICASISARRRPFTDWGRLVAETGEMLIARAWPSLGSCRKGRESCGRLLERLGHKIHVRACLPNCLAIAKRRLTKELSVSVLIQYAVCGQYAICVCYMCVLYVCGRCPTYNGQLKPQSGD